MKVDFRQTICKLNTNLYPLLTPEQPGESRSHKLIKKGSLSYKIHVALIQIGYNFSNFYRNDRIPGIDKSELNTSEQLGGKTDTLVDDGVGKQSLDTGMQA